MSLDARPKIIFSRAVMLPVQDITLLRIMVHLEVLKWRKEHPEDKSYEQRLIALHRALDPDSPFNNI